MKNKRFSVLFLVFVSLVPTLSLAVAYPYRWTTYEYQTNTGLRIFAPWDITGSVKWLSDMKCDIRDITQVAIPFGSIAGDSRYDQRADITGDQYLVPDGKIDIRDVALVAKHFGETYP